MAYAYTPENCPTKHHNPGDDICSDCGVYLNGSADGPEIVAAHGDEYPESGNSLPKAEAARLMARSSRSLHGVLRDMVRLYDLRPSLNAEQPAVTAEVFPCCIDELSALAACLEQDWIRIADAAEKAEAEARARANPEPETRRVVILSTAHLTEATCEMLRTTPLAEWPVAGAPLVHGFYIYVHDCDANEHPADLEACFAWARGRFDYIQFDCDAEARADIPSYY